MDGLRLIALYDDREAAEGEIHEEAGRLTAPRGILTDLTILKGLVIGLGLGLLVGTVIGSIGNLAFSPPGSDAGFLFASLVGAGTAGSVAGALLGAYRSFEWKRRARERRLTGDTALIVTAADPEMLRRAEVIVREMEPRYVERTMPPRHRRVG